MDMETAWMNGNRADDRSGGVLGALPQATKQRAWLTVPPLSTWWPPSPWTQRAPAPHHLLGAPRGSLHCGVPPQGSPSCSASSTRASGRKKLGVGCHISLRSTENDPWLPKCTFKVSSYCKHAGVSEKYLSAPRLVLCPVKKRLGIFISVHRSWVKQYKKGGFRAISNKFQCLYNELKYCPKHSKTIFS